MKLVSKILPFIAVVMLVAAVVFAQAPATGQIHGKVTDKDGKPLSGLTIGFDRTQAPTTHAGDTKTDGQGTYKSPALPAAEYRVSIMQAGAVLFALTTKVSAGGDAALDFDAKKLAGDADAERAKIEAENKAALDVRSTFAQGKAAYDAKNYEEAARLFQQAAVQDPKQDVIFVNLAEALNGAKKYDDAAAAYQKAIELKPAEGVYYMNMGVILGNAGKVEEASAALAKSAQLSPATASQSWYNLGAVLTNRNKLPEALDAFTKSTEAGPTNADAFFQLGVTHIGLNHMAEAVPAFQKYLALAPTGPMADSAKSLIEAAKMQAPAAFKSDAALAAEKKAADDAAKAQKNKQKKGQ